MKMNMAMASTRKDTSRIANAGVDTGANMLGVGATAMTTVVKTILRPPAGTHPSCPRCGPCVLLLSRGTCGPLIVVTEVFSKNTQAFRLDGTGIAIIGATIMVVSGVIRWGQ